MKEIGQDRTRRRFRAWATILLIGALQATLLGYAGARWWAMRNNSLYGRGDWLVGKNEVKFVFHTYEYMFNPLTDGVLRLNASMGFQEVYYREPENENRRLRRLRATIGLSPRTYLWVILRQTDSGMRALRLSRSAYHPSGLFHFGPDGDLLDSDQFEIPLHQEINELEIRFHPGAYTLFLNGAEVRRIEDPGPARGRFGFRGCGYLRGICTVTGIRLDFEDPRNPARQWSVIDKFHPGRETRRLFPYFAGGAIVLLAWRIWRRRLLSGLLPAEKRAVFARSDDLVFLIAMAVTTVAAYQGSAVAIPLGLLAAEVGTWTLLGIGRRGSPPPARIPAAPGLLFAAVGLLLLIGAAGRHGRYFGRERMVSPGNMSYVHLDALHLDPAPGTSSAPFRLETPLTLIPGRPFFIPERAYRGQRVRMTFVPEAETTLDLVFQQQTFSTHGDPRGEPILYQRRTLRLSTRDDVASGLSPETSFRVNPVYRLNGVPRPGEANHLELISTARGVTVILNGEKTDHPGLAILAEGETGVMVFENSARIERLEVSPLDGGGRGGAGRRTAFHWIWPLAAAILLLWPTDRRDWPGRVGLTAAAGFPLMVYLAFAWILSPGARFFLGMERVHWLNILLAASAAAYLFLVLMLRRTSRAAALAFNLATVALLASIFLWIWDRLPADHPVKARWLTHVIFPAGEPAESSPDSAPWYSNNRLIGANTYMIHQQFGGRSPAIPKPAGEIRVFGLGGSQAWGSGAAGSDETFFALLGRKLEVRGLPVEVYNASVNGAGIPMILNIVREILPLFEPDLLILDTGLNDSMALRQFRSEPRQKDHRQILLDLFSQILELAEERGIDVILCLEPISREMPLRPDPDLYRGLEERARRAGVAVVSPLADLEAVEADTFLWWDTAHLTPYGHRLMARLLLPETEAVIRSRLDAAGGTSLPPK